MREEHGQVRCGIAQRRAKEDAFLALPAAACSSYVAEIVVADRLELEGLILAEESQGEGGEDRGRSY